MALTDDQLSIVRDEIGPADPPSDSDLDDLHDRYGGLVGVVRAVWKQRLAVLLGTPASFTVVGEYGQNTSANIDAIRRRLFELSGAPDDSDEIPPSSGATSVKFYPMQRAGQDR